jgi:hypothetical protein
MARNYGFMPQQADPRISGERHWADMVNELEIVREQLERANAENISHAEIVDMLRIELAEAKSQHRKDRDALIVVRTKLKVAGQLVLDALKDDETLTKVEIAAEVAPSVAEKPTHEIVPEPAPEPYPDSEPLPEPPPWRPEVAAIKPLQDVTRMAPIQTLVEPPEEDDLEDEVANVLRGTVLPKSGWP